MPTEEVARLVGRWVQFGDEEQARVRDSREFLLPACVDSEGNGKSSDWVFLRLRSTDAFGTLNAGSGLAVDVADRHGRTGLAQRLATMLCGVLPLTRHRLLGT